MSNEVNNAAVNNNNSNNGVYPADLENRITVKGEEKMETSKLWFNKEQFTILQPHPYAGFLPMIASKHEVEALKEGIRVHGLLEPITIHEGKILDGRNRHRAICELMAYDKDFKYEDVVRFAPVPEGFSPEQYVITRNLHRRNLNESQRALFAGMMLLEFKEDKTLSKAERTNLPGGNKTDHFGKIFNVSGSSVKSAQVVIKQGLPMIKEFVQKGVWRLSLAKKIAELKPEEQQQLVGDARKNGNSLADQWFEKHSLHLNKQEVELTSELEKIETERNVQINALRHGLNQELASVSLLPEAEQASKKKYIADMEAKIEDGTHPSLKEHSAKIQTISGRLEKYRKEQKKMMDDEVNQKELYAQSKLAQCMIGSHKQYMRSRNKASLVVSMNFTGNAPEVEFKVVPAKQASKFLGMIKEFANSAEGEAFRAANKTKLDALKIEIMNRPLTEAPIIIQGFCEGLTESSAA